MTSLLEFGKTCELMTPAGLGLSDSAIETLAYFKSRNRICRRWAENYIERTRLIMDLFFSIGSQVDSRTNLEIANLTSTIARDAQRDSSSLITIAAVTMVFLPGTFISVGLSTSTPFLYTTSSASVRQCIQCRTCLPNVHSLPLKTANATLGRIQHGLFQRRS